jgi:hypothetical protein
MSFVSVLHEILPHGSGIDCEWEIEEVYTESFKCYNYFHVMDGNGYYCGYIPFQCTVFFFQDKGFSLGELKITKHIIDLIQSDYKLPNGELDESAPFLDDLDDYLFETIEYSLEQYNEDCYENIHGCKKSC